MAVNTIVEMSWIRSSKSLKMIKLSSLILYFEGWTSHMTSAWLCCWRPGVTLSQHCHYTAAWPMVFRLRLARTSNSPPLSLSLSLSLSLASLELPGQLLSLQTQTLQIIELLSPPPSYWQSTVATSQLHNLHWQGRYKAHSPTDLLSNGCRCSTHIINGTISIPFGFFRALRPCHRRNNSW